MSYMSILADPPWEYGDKLRQSDVKRSSTDQYPTMSVQAICDLYQSSQVQHVHSGKQGYTVQPGRFCGMYPVAETALLGLWITAPFLLDGIHQRVCGEWGFTPRQIVPWIKGRLAVEKIDISPAEWEPRAKLVIQPGMGHLTRGCVEYLVLATRGKYTQHVKSRSINGLLLAEEDAILVAAKSKHSRKPNEAYAMLENLFPGPRLELFATQAREGWDAWGNAIQPTMDGLDEGEIEWPA